MSIRKDLYETLLKVGENFNPNDIPKLINDTNNLLCQYGLMLINREEYIDMIDYWEARNERTDASR